MSADEIRRQYYEHMQRVAWKKPWYLRLQAKARQEVALEFAIGRKNR